MTGKDGLTAGQAPATSAQDRTVRLGDTTVELTEREVRLRIVGYLYRPRPGANIEQRWASVEEVQQARSPAHLFQVSPDGYRSLLAKAGRIEALWRGPHEVMKS